MCRAMNDLTVLSAWEAITALSGEWSGVYSTVSPATSVTSSFDDEPRFDPVTGRLVSRSQPITTSQTEPEPEEEQRGETWIVEQQRGHVQVWTPNESLIDAYKKRTFQGVDKSMEKLVIEPGMRGVARSYQSLKFGTSDSSAVAASSPSDETGEVSVAK